ncbi:ACP S-malonyltransferase [Rubellicoccus peritrichatus]|uniref:Malonyl CoA-acyl carrier protein transacylase n=1 Tax=Rubellicoccus peritrichatus TaxID=3080537 RepID=A0AAQ3L8I6_9BACT|nr:ACP S-malonyltransferase [Puniceicoccus sp. CR14]WOO41061.1 ACP S-malonyltransferase [Puniceicoccus sp. CR14]
MSIGLIFSGQGAQAVGMGASLYENSAAAKARFDEANEILGWSLTELCFDGPEEKLTETRVCQPALYVHGCAAVEALKEQGKLPQISAAAGLSLGELTAHAIAGTYDFATGLQLVAERGRLMQEACDATEGAMASLIGGSVDAARELAKKHDVDLGNLNCPGQTVISGPKEGIAAAVADAKAAGFKMAVPLKVAGAYHSRLMQPAREAFQQFIEGFNFKTPDMPVLTNTTGDTISEPNGIKAALVSQITSPVLWESCFRSMMAMGVQSFYECGPGNTLAGLAKRIDKEVPVITKGEWENL